MELARAHLGAAAAVAVLSLVAGCGPGAEDGPARPAAIDPARSALGASAPAVANGAAAVTLTATARDAAGAALAGREALFTVSGDPSTLSAANATTGADGVATVTVTATSAGQREASVTIDDVAIVQRATVTFVPGEAASVAFAIPPASATAGDLLAVVDVAVVDAHGNLVSSPTAASVGLGGGGALGGTAVATAVGGHAPFADLSIRQAGTHTLTATVAGLSPATSAPFEVMPAGPDAGASDVSAAPAALSAGGSATLSATVRDAFGNLVPGTVVRFAATGAANALTQPPGATGPDGAAEESLSSTRAEAKTVSARAGGVLLSASPPVRFTASEPDASTSSLVASPATAPDDGTPVTVTVTVSDAWGNPVAGETVTLAATPDASVTQPASPTSAAGATSGSVSTLVRGVKAVSARVGATTVAERDVTFTAAPPDPGTSTVTAIPPEIPSDGTVPCTATVAVRDVLGRPVAGASIALAYSAAATIAPERAVSDASGIATFQVTSAAPGSGTLTATATAAGATTGVVLSEQPALTVVERTYALSGRIVGATLAGVTVSLSGGANATATTDASGAYAFGALPGAGRYTVTPAKNGFVFSPPSVSATLSTEAPRGTAPDARASACSEDGWCWENPVPQGNSLRAAWTASDADAWAVGSAGTILRWDGTAWTKYASGTTRDLYGVWAASPSDAWAVGYSFSGGQNRAAILRWDGSSWSTVAGVDTPQLVAVWGAAADDVWAVGSGIWHWDGSTWSAAAAGVRANAVWGVSAHDVWAVGDGGAVAHWDGSAWSSVPSGVAARSDPLFGFSITPNLRGVWGSAANDVWAAGTHGTVVHWDGTRWSDLIGETCSALQLACSGSMDTRCSGTGLCCDATCSGAQAYDYGALAGGAGGEPWLIDRYTDQSRVALRRDGSAWRIVSMGDVQNVIGGSGVAGTEPWFVGARGELVRWNGTSWTRGWAGTTVAMLYDVWGTSRDDAWAVGSGGTVLHWDGGAWSTVPNPLSGISNASLNAVWGSSASDVWCVGNGATILHWDGTGWSTVANPLGAVADSPTLEAVWGSSPSDVWAVGAGMLRWDGVRWIQAQLPEGAVAFKGVWGSAADDVWALARWPAGSGSGASGIVHWNGSAWSTAFMGTPLLAIWGAAANDAWAVGEGGAIVHWNGAAWVAVPSGVTTVLTAVWGSSGSDVWVGGGGGVLLHWDGRAWSRVASGTTEYQLEALWGASASDVRAAGSFGTLLRYRP